jgi:hypothetical protein
MYPFGFRVKLHVTLWFQSESSCTPLVSEPSRTPLVSEWNFMYLFGFRVKLHAPLWCESETSCTPWSQCESACTPLISEWNSTNSLVSEWKFMYPQFRTANLGNMTILYVIATAKNGGIRSAEMSIIIIRHVATSFYVHQCLELSMQYFQLWFAWFSVDISSSCCQGALMFVQLKSPRVHHYVITERCI